MKKTHATDTFLDIFGKKSSSSKAPAPSEIYRSAPLPEKKEDSEGHFGVGFVFGALLGVTGMYLFGTKEGRDRLGTFKEEWKEYEPVVEETARRWKLSDIAENLKKITEYLKLKQNE